MKTSDVQLEISPEYLKLKPEPRSKEAIYRERDAAERLFTDHVAVFLDNKDRILADRPMFLSRVPVVSGLAYTGTSGFRDPTLGVYLEWWDSCPEAHFTDKDGTQWLVYYIAGSPLSGSNKCGYVNRKGERMYRSAEKFLPIWSSFMRINQKYAQEKLDAEYLSLRDVIGLLS